MVLYKSGYIPGAFWSLSDGPVSGWHQSVRVFHWYALFVIFVTLRSFSKAPHEAPAKRKVGTFLLQNFCLLVKKTIIYSSRVDSSSCIGSFSQLPLPWLSRFMGTPRQTMSRFAKPTEEALKNYLWKSFSPLLSLQIDGDVLYHKWFL
jgi:hypothetical protein